MQAFITLTSTKLPVTKHCEFITTDGYLCSHYDTSAKQIKELKLGVYPTIALTVDGQVWRATSQARQFKPIILNERVVQVAVGISHSVLLTESGRIWVAGRNEHGQLGLGYSGRRYTFTLVEGLPTVIHVIATSHNTLIITDAGELWGCGFNRYGELGLDDNEDRNVFTQVVSSERVLAG